MDYQALKEELNKRATELIAKRDQSKLNEARYDEKSPEVKKLLQTIAKKYFKVNSLDDSTQFSVSSADLKKALQDCYSEGYKDGYNIKK